MSSNIKLDFKLDPFPPVPFFFLKRGIPPFSFNPISLSRSCQKTKASSHQSAVYFLGVIPTGHRVPWGSCCPASSGAMPAGRGRVPCPQPWPQAPPGPGHPSGLESIRAAVPEAAQRAAQPRFYLQPADNRVEIDRSCRQRVTPCLSAPNGSSCHYSLDRSSLTLSGLALIHRLLQVSTMFLFMPSLWKCSSTAFG